MYCRTDWFKKKKQQLFKCVSEKDANLETVFPALKEGEQKGKEVLEKLVKEKNEQGNTALHYAAKAGNSYKCRVLKDKGADINAKNSNGMTPLEFAARQGDGKPEQVFKCIDWIMREEKIKDGTAILHGAIKTRTGEQTPMLHEN